MTTQKVNFEIILSVCQQLGDAEASLKFWDESMAMSHDSLVQSLKKWEEALNDHDLKKLSQALHKVVGTISFVGVKDLTDHLSHLQAAADDGSLTFPLADQSMLQQQLLGVMNEIQAARNQPPKF